MGFLIISLPPRLQLPFSRRFKETLNSAIHRQQYVDSWTPHWSARGPLMNWPTPLGRILQDDHMKDSARGIFYDCQLASSTWSLSTNALFSRIPWTFSHKISAIAVAAFIPPFSSHYPPTILLFRLSLHCLLRLLVRHSHLALTLAFRSTFVLFSFLRRFLHTGSPIPRLHQ